MQVYFSTEMTLQRVLILQKHLLLGKKLRQVNEDKVKKAWEVSVGKAELSEIRFRMTDSVSGIYINQYAGHILIETEIMSLIEKTVIVRSLELDGATGSITMNPQI